MKINVMSIPMAHFAQICGVRTVSTAFVALLLCGTFNPVRASTDAGIETGLHATIPMATVPNTVAPIDFDPALSTPTLSSASGTVPALSLPPALEIRDVRDNTSPLASQPSNPIDDSNLWDRVRAGFSMPNLETSHVTNREQFHAARPEELRAMFNRGRRYLFHIVEELEKRGMPTELALLPIVESAFNPLAHSHAHASGLWQFIPSTGRSYNLNQTWWFDARRDIVASTTAALDYLQFIYQMHGDWHLALASYNWGENAVARAVERNRRLGLPTDYASLQMPDETRWYVPKLQALKNLLASANRTGLVIDPIPNAPHFATITLTRDIDLKLAARLADMPEQELIALNPGHNRPVVSTAQSPTLVLPAEKLDRFIANVANHDKPLSSWRTVQVARGERIDAIAATHGMTVDRLRQVNGIRGTGRLRDDTELLVPIEGARPESPLALFQAPPTIFAEAERARMAHAIGRGETWASVAARYGVTAAALQSWNDGARFANGQRLNIMVATVHRVAVAAPVMAVRPIAARVIAARPKVLSAAKHPATRSPAAKAPGRDVARPIRASAPAPTPKPVAKRT